VLCVALLMGILALKPSIPISGVLSAKSRVDPEQPKLWLDPEAVLAMATTNTELEVLRDLCVSAAANGRDAHHNRTLRDRRLLMFRQIVFLLLSLGLLIVALVGFLITGQ
jgi:hypothetical protein